MNKSRGQLAYEAFRDFFDTDASPSKGLGGWNYISNREKLSWQNVASVLTKEKDKLIKDAEFRGYNTATCPWCSNWDKDDSTVKKPLHAQDCRAFTREGVVK